MTQKIKIEDLEKQTIIISNGEVFHSKIINSISYDLFEGLNFNSLLRYIKNIKPDVKDGDTFRPNNSNLVITLI